ncbi:hypothetical protein KZO83_07645 [Chromohalobacter sp. TMW 2.2308]|uniref:Uncharacterized protein n=1 Tax=Chromohalobacter moromii TaxID=2860329 RepID=A0A9X3B6W0_9GAMM|nr:hypothetical protein [Chromohalobacter moromii]MCK2042560.1 hypothetical protein [Chromohalobacter moromii]MCT8506143.1 hypothetical protein [Chromohalobacter moromii]
MATTQKDSRKLTSMTFKRPWHRYTKGDRAGFEPERAKQLEERKIAVPTASLKKDAGGETKASNSNSNSKSESAADKA